MSSLWTLADTPFKPQGRDSLESMGKEMTANLTFLGAYESNCLVGLVVLSSDTRNGCDQQSGNLFEVQAQRVAIVLVKEAERVFQERGFKLFAALVDDFNEASEELSRKRSYLEHHGIVYLRKRENEDVSFRTRLALLLSLLCGV